MRHVYRTTSNRRDFIRLTFTTGAMGCAFGPKVLLARRQEMEPEIFECEAGATATSDFAEIRITIDRWTTAEERERLLNTLDREGPDRAVEDLARQEETGTFSVDNRAEYRLRYAWQVPVGEGRRIVLATDRPFDTRSNREPIVDQLTLIQFDLDGEGTGEGVLVVGAEVSFDEDTGVLWVDDYYLEPVPLTNIFKSQ